MSNVRQEEKHKWRVQLANRRKNGRLHGPYAVITRTNPDGRHIQMYLGRAQVNDAGLIKVAGKILDMEKLNTLFPPGTLVGKRELLSAL